MGECDPTGEHEVRPYDDDDNDAGVMGEHEVRPYDDDDNDADVMGEHEVRPYDDDDSAMRIWVAAVVPIPPRHCARARLAPWTWAAPASPRSCRTSSMI